MLSFFGGKSKMGEWIYQFIPKDITTYAEPFSGSFWVYFNTKLNYNHVKNIRYNDINRYTTNLFACAKDYNKFTKILETALSTGGFLYADKSDPDKFKEFYKQLYYSFKNDSSNTFLDDDSFNIPDYEVGMKYSFLITSAFNGCWPKAAGFSGVQGIRLKLGAFQNKLKDKKYQAKLDAIDSFETLDFETFINKYDDEKTFFYLDPPYEDPKNNRLNWYGVKDDSKFGRFSHKRLADLLKNTKSRWALSYYYFDDLEVWFPKDKYVWIEKDFFRSSASFSENKSTKGTEVLILNYDPKEMINFTSISEKLVNEIEDENDGAFINSTVSNSDGTSITFETPTVEKLNKEIDIVNNNIEKIKIAENFANKLISSQKDIEPDVQKTVNEVFWDLITEEEKKEEVKPVVKPDDEEIDDFWNS